MNVWDFIYGEISNIRIYTNISRQLIFSENISFRITYCITVTQTTLKMNWRESQNVLRLSNMHFYDRISVFWVVIQTVVN